MKRMFCFVNDKVYMGVKLQMLIKYHTKYFRVIDVIGVNGECFFCKVKFGWMDGFITIIDKNLSRNTLLILTRKKNMEKSDLCCIKSFLE